MRVGALLSTCGFQELSFGPDAGSKHLYPLSLAPVDFVVETFSFIFKKGIGIMEGGRASLSF